LENQFKKAPKMEIKHQLNVKKDKDKRKKGKTSVKVEYYKGKEGVEEGEAR